MNLFQNKSKTFDNDKINKQKTKKKPKKGLSVLIAIIAVSIIVISGIQKWGETQEARAQSEMAQAQAMEQLSKAMDTMQGVVNTQQLQITPLIKLMYNTSNIQNLINSTRENNV